MNKSTGFIKHFHTKKRPIGAVQSSASIKSFYPYHGGRGRIRRSKPLTDLNHVSMITGCSKSWSKSWDKPLQSFSSSLLLVQHKTEERGRHVCSNPPYLRL